MTENKNISVNARTMKSVNTFSRRRFMKNVSSVAALSAVSLTGLDCRGGMKYRMLGRTGIRASVINSDELPEKEMYEMAVAQGVNYWHKMGRWGEPDIFTKLDRDSFVCDLTIDSIEKDRAIEEFERGLARSGLSMIDGFKVHSVYDYPEELKTRTGMIQAFEILKKQGKTRFLMLSQHRNVVEIMEAAIESDLFDAIQIPVHPLVPHDYFIKEQKFHTYSHDKYLATIKKAADRGIGITAMKVVVGGPKNWDKIPDFHRKIQKHLPPHDNIKKALIHWALAVPGVKTFTSSLKSFEMFRENIEAAGGQLTVREKELVKRFAAVMDRYVCRMCGKCESENPGGVRVSDILRYSMYYSGYGDRERARALYAALPWHSRVEVTGDLDRYEKVCPYGLPVARMLREARMLLA